MSDDEKSIYLSLAMGLVEMVKSAEEDLKPKGARVTALNNFYAGAGKLIDMYRLVSWPLEKQLLAGAVLDKIQEVVSKAFSPKLVTRSANGRFTKTI